MRKCGRARVGRKHAAELEVSISAKRLGFEGTLPKSGTLKAKRKK